MAKSRAKQTNKWTYYTIKKYFIQICTCLRLENKIYLHLSTRMVLITLINLYCFAYGKNVIHLFNLKFFDIKMHKKYKTN